MNCTLIDPVKRLLYKFILSNASVLMNLRRARFWSRINKRLIKKRSPNQFHLIAVYFLWNFLMFKIKVLPKHVLSAVKLFWKLQIVRYCLRTSLKLGWRESELVQCFLYGAKSRSHSVLENSTAQKLYFEINEWLSER